MMMIDKIKKHSYSEGKVKQRIFLSHGLHFGVCLFSLLTAIPLFAILITVIVKGAKYLTLTFISKPMPTSYDAMVAMNNNLPIDGGIVNGIIGTLLMLLLACVVVIPVGIATGVFLSERKTTKFAKVVSYLTDLLQGTPSIIVGIIVYAVIVIPMKGYSGLAGGIALMIIMLPLIIRSTEEALNLLPKNLKEAALSLGSNYFRCVFHVLIPSAFGGIFTGIMLSISRAIGETAPLTFTALGCAAIQWNIQKPMSAIPLLIWQFFNDPSLQSLIWAASLLLLIIVLIINISAKIISRKWKIS